jgi:hypothetical protein
MKTLRIMYAVAVLIRTSFKYRKDIQEEYLCENNLVTGE